MKLWDGKKSLNNTAHATNSSTDRAEEYFTEIIITATIEYLKSTSIVSCKEAWWTYLSFNFSYLNGHFDNLTHKF